MRFFFFLQTNFKSIKSTSKIYIGALKSENCLLKLVWIEALQFIDNKKAIFTN